MFAEPFWSKSTFDMGMLDRKSRMKLKSTTPIWDKYRLINTKKEAKALNDQLEKTKFISRANSPYCAQRIKDMIIKERKR